MSKTPDQKPCACPKCGEPFSLEMVARAADESRFTLSLTPMPGEMFGAETIGGMITDTAALFQSANKAIGAPLSSCMVERIDTEPNGRVSIRFVLCRVATSAITGKEG